MWAMTRSGHVVEERASWARCLYVNRDLRLRPIVGEMGEEARNGCEEDIATEEVEAFSKHQMCIQLELETASNLG